MRARVADNGDGSYKVTYKPSVSGKYSVAISLFGTSLPGSPFPLTVINNQPDATHCILQGPALTSIIARASSSFEVRFRDLLDKPAIAEELDVFVEPLQLAAPPGESPDVETREAPASAPSPEAGASLADEASDAEDGAAPAAAPAPAPASAANSEAATTKAAATSRAGKGASTFKKARIEVGAKPLILRAGVATASDLIGKLRPGQLLTVVDERRSAWTCPPPPSRCSRARAQLARARAMTLSQATEPPAIVGELGRSPIDSRVLLAAADGDVRAKVALVYEDESSELFADSWWTANPLLRTYDPALVSPLDATWQLGSSSSALLINSFAAGAASTYGGGGDPGAVGAQPTGLGGGALGGFAATTAVPSSQAGTSAAPDGGSPSTALDDGASVAGSIELADGGSARKATGRCTLGTATRMTRSRAAAFSSTAPWLHFCS